MARAVSEQRKIPCMIHEWADFVLACEMGGETSTLGKSVFEPPHNCGTTLIMGIVVDMRYISTLFGSAWELGQCYRVEEAKGGWMKEDNISNGCPCPPLPSADSSPLCFHPWFMQCRWCNIIISFDWTQGDMKPWAVVTRGHMTWTQVDWNRSFCDLRLVWRKRLKGSISLWLGLHDTVLWLEFQDLTNILVYLLQSIFVLCCACHQSGNMLRTEGCRMLERIHLVS